MTKNTPLKTPTRRSPRLNQEPICLDSTPTRCLYLSFDLNAFTPSPIRNDSVVVDSKSCKSKSITNHPSKLVKGKEKACNLPHDSDFEDELPLLKRIRINKKGKSSIVKSKLIRCWLLLS